MGLIEDKRKQIDKIDTEIATLLSRRFSITKEIGIIKKEEHTDTLDISREEEIISAVRSVADSRKEEVTEVYRKIMEISRREQDKLPSVGLLGHPLQHSYSPEIFSEFNENYSLFDYEEKEALRFIKNKAFYGINVTIPYKKLALRNVDYVHPIASECGAVNTVIVKEGVSYGYNTDYEGLKRMLEFYGVCLKQKHVTVFGKGGTANMAKCLCTDLGASKIDLIGREDKPNYKQTQIIIQATPVGMYPASDGKICDISVFAKLECVIDAVYHPIRTPLVYDAQKRGILAFGGLYMLCAQAKCSYDLFLGRKTNYDISELYQKLFWEKSNLVLVGMPSCGKSAIGQRLASLADKTFLDTDAEIVRRERMTIPEIFDKYGEDYFRQKEEEIISRLADTKGLVIATGGGSILKKENRYHLAQNGVVVYIERDTDLLIFDNRPLSKDKETLQRLFNERQPLYKEIADITVRNDGDIASCVDKIINKVEHYYETPHFERTEY